jgi:hypothetical protein
MSEKLKFRKCLEKEQPGMADAYVMIKVRKRRAVTVFVLTEVGGGFERRSGDRCLDVT